MNTYEKLVALVVALDDMDVFTDERCDKLCDKLQVTEDELFTLLDVVHDISEKQLTLYKNKIRYHYD